MGLTGMLQLQPVLHLAQKLVGQAEVVKIFAAQMPFVMQFLQAEQRSAWPQPGWLL